MTGESYGGHYLPSFSMRLVKKGYKLAGVAIGDGIVTSIKQFTLADFLLSTGTISKYRHDFYTNLEHKAS